MLEAGGQRASGIEQLEAGRCPAPNGNGAQPPATFPPPVEATPPPPGAPQRSRPPQRRPRR